MDFVKYRLVLVLFSTKETSFHDISLMKRLLKFYPSGPARLITY
eukprot:UN11368